MKIYMKEGITKMKEAFLQMWITFPSNDMVSCNASSGSFKVKNIKIFIHENVNIKSYNDSH